MKLWTKKTSEQIAGFLDQGTSVTGELQFSGILRIDGNFHGSISSPDTLVIGEHAVVHADISVGALEVHGQVFGTVQVKRRTEIFSNGKLRGDLQTATLVIQVGAVFDGRSRMPGEGDAAPVRETTQVVAAEETPIQTHSEGLGSPNQQ
jgi:cytoskeletal protein CcmA (bactofilin family)